MHNSSRFTIMDLTFDELMGIINNGTIVLKTNWRKLSSLLFPSSCFTLLLTLSYLVFILLNYASRVEEVHLVDGVLFPQSNQIAMKQ